MQPQRARQRVRTGPEPERKSPFGIDNPQTSFAGKGAPLAALSTTVGTPRALDGTGLGTPTCFKRFGRSSRRSYRFRRKSFRDSQAPEEGRRSQLLERLPPCRILHGDKGYDTDAAIRSPDRGDRRNANIPPKANRRWKNCFSPALYCGRNAIERMFCRPSAASRPSREELNDVGPGPSAASDGPHGSPAIGGAKRFIAPPG